MTEQDRRVVHDVGTAHGMFRLLDGETELARTEYAEADRRTHTAWVFNHTYTQPEHRGHGYAEEVVKVAVDAARADGHEIVARCWFVANYLNDHPDESGPVARRPGVETT